MVTPSYYADARRYSRQDPTYGYSDRPQRLSHSSESRSSTMTEREPDTDTPPRKRIAVACGRCRKRKIRCSGDPGHGLPCQNCKAAGADSCMFLRVASTEAPFVTTSEFAYEMKAARAYQAHHGMASPLTASPPHYASEIHDGLARYPPSSTVYSPYTGGGKYYSPAATMPTWSATAGYSDDGTGAVDYSAAATMGYSYPYHSHDPGYYYRMTAKAAAAASTAGDLYADATASYGYGSSSSAALLHRPAAATASVHSEGPSFSLSNVAASLPHAGGGGSGDRLLPNPTSRLPNTNVLAYRTDTGAPAVSYAASASSSKSSGSPTSQTSQPTTAVAEVTTAYSAPVAGSGSYESSSLSTYPPPAHTLPSMAHHRLSTAADMAGYPPSSSTTGGGGGGGGGDSIFSAAETSLRTHGSASELSYKYTDGPSVSSSSASLSAGRRGSDETTGPSSGSSGSLSNGQQYTVTAPSAAGLYAAVTGHGRHHVSQYMISDDVADDDDHHHHHHQHHHHQADRRSACGLSAS
ncbi:hypothetical protein QIS74_07173 [Colletotrichum tabaci]|uniref:Zn(2)-C6 fungal-type domain-containing protein n=1 Tax=Colletotrichum tabaci TaxID=1209068 RepID=A0AAV9TB43_9PEZI